MLFTCISTRLYDTDLAKRANCDAVFVHFFAMFFNMTSKLKYGSFICAVVSSVMEIVAAQVNGRILNTDFNFLIEQALRGCLRCSVTLTVGEPLGDVSGSANHDF